MTHLLWLISHWLGLDNLSGSWYGFWSGFGSDITELAILGGLIKLYSHHNCKVKRCYRIGHHPVKGTPYKTCHKHATLQIHGSLNTHHKKHHPLQHQLLNKETK